MAARLMVAGGLKEVAGTDRATVGEGTVGAPLKTVVISASERAEA